MLRYTLIVCWILIGMPVYGQLDCQDAITQGLRLQIQADSMQRLMEAQNLALSQAKESQKNNIRVNIRDFEAQATYLQKQADEWFAQAATFESDEPVRIVAENVIETENAPEIIESVEIIKSVETKSAPKSEFSILPKSPYSAAYPVPVDESLPDGVAYKIQLGAFSKPVSTSIFKGLTPLSAEKLDNGITKYYVGLFRRFTDADDALRKVREYGYKDAYIVAFYNQKTINPERAKQLEK